MEEEEGCHAMMAWDSDQFWRYVGIWDRERKRRDKDGREEE